MSSVLDPGSLAEVNRAIEDAKALAYAESTRKSDKQRVDTFLRWCATTGLDPQTQAAEALQLYLVAAEGRWSKSHLVSVVAAVQRHHVARGWPNPADEATRAIARCLVSTYEQSPRLALPITVAEARALITVIPMVIRRSEYAQRRTSAQLRFALGGALRAGDKAGLPLHHYPLEATPAAHDAVEQGAVGKVLIDVAATE